MNDSPPSPEVQPRSAVRPVAQRPPRWRFSLATILLLLTIVALVVSHVRISRELALREAQLNAQLEAAQAELERLRMEVGYLDVTDKTKLHVVAAPTHLDMDWKWKIFVPEGKSFHVYDLVELSSGGSVSTHLMLDPGENLVEFAIYKGPAGDWKYKLIAQRGISPSSGRSSGSGALPEAFMTWVGNSQTSTSGLLHADGTHQYEVDRTVNLLKMTAKPTRPRDEATAEEDMAETEIRVWIEPAPEEAN